MKQETWELKLRSFTHGTTDRLLMNTAFRSRLLLLSLLLCSGIICASGNAQDESEPLSLEFAGQLGVDPFGDGEPEVTLSANFELIEGTLQGRINVTAEVREDQHIYSVNQQPRGPTKSTITVVLGQGVELTGPFQPDTPPTIKFFQDIYPDLPIEEHEGTVTWSAPIQLEEGIDTASLVISVEYDGLACTNQEDGAGACIPQSHTAEAGFEGYFVASQASSQGVAFDPDKVTVKSDSQNKSLGLILLLAFAAGFILNFMPCVLPVVGLKIMTFVEQAGESRQRIFMLNLWFSLGMLTVFLILATLARVISLGWGAQFSSLAFNIVLVAVVFVFALSFLGIWEIPIPGFSVRTKQPGHDAGIKGTGMPGLPTEREGAVGAFAKGMFTTVLATPCSGPLLFPALTYSVSQPILITYLGFSMVGLGMAFPYLMIGAFPQLISFLPRPGAWMETFKHIMGFVLLATVVWLMTIVATVSLPALVPLVGFLFALWAACWWYGKVPLTAGRAARGMALLQGGIFSALIGWVMFSEMALGGVMESRFDQVMDREVATRIADLDEPTGPVDPAGELQWERYSVDRLTELTAQQKTVFVDFTADW
jgi:thiol:disulfide interchange protein DsbD